MIFKTHIRGNQRRNQEASHLIYEWFADFFTPIQFPQMPTGTWRITVIWHLPTTNTVAAKHRLTALISEDENESRWSERGLLEQRSQNTESQIGPKSPAIILLTIKVKRLFNLETVREKVFSLNYTESSCLSHMMHSKRKHTVWVSEKS